MIWSNHWKKNDLSFNKQYQFTYNEQFLSYNMWELLFNSLPHFLYFYEIRLIELWVNRTGGQRHHAQLSFPSRCLENENSKKNYNFFFLKMERFKKIETVENKNINYFLPFIFWNSLLPASNWIFAYKAENQKKKIYSY